MSIADRPALGPGLVCGYIAYSGFSLNWTYNPYDALANSSGFLGAIVGGFLAGYLVICSKKIV